MLKLLKAIIYMVIFAMFISSAAFADTYVPSDVIGTDAENPISILLQLKIFESIDGELFNPDETVTRAEFAVIIAKLLGFKDTAGNSLGASDQDVMFNDVKQDNPAFFGINYSAKMGIINGYENGNFGADDNVTYEQAVKAVVCVLGYEKYAKQKGGYPSGYIQTALEKGILKRASGSVGDAIKRGSMALMIYYALDTPVLKQVRFGADGKFTVTDTETLLTRNLNIHKDKGRLTGNKDTILGTNSMLSDKEVEINGQIYKVGETNAENFLGYNIEFYYETDKTTDDKILRAVVPEKGRNDALVIKADEFYSYSKNKLTYQNDETNGDKLTDVTISDLADFVYNGKAFVGNNENINTLFQNFKSGEITLLDSDGNNEYDIVIISKYDTYVVSDINPDNYMVYDKYVSGHMIELKPALSNVKIEIIDTDLNPLDVSDLKEWDIISVRKSLDSKLIKAVVSRKNISGTISEIYNDGDSYKLIIEENEYEVSQSFNHTFKIDDQGTFYFDIEGKIAAFDGESINLNLDNSKYGYVINADITKGLDADVQLKLLTDSGEIKILSCAKNIIIDGYNDKTKDDIKTLSNNRLIRYKVNSEGKVNYIDTTAVGINENENNLTISHDYTTSAVKFKLSTKNFSGNFRVSDSTLVFYIPLDVNDDSDYMVFNPVQLFKNDISYCVASYDESDVRIAKALVFKEADNKTTLRRITVNTSFAIVDHITTYIENDGDEYTKLYCFKDGKQISIVINRTYDSNFADQSIVDPTLINDMSNLKPGDIIRYTTDIKGRLYFYKKIYDIDNDDKNAELKPFNDPAVVMPRSDFSADYFVAYGTVFAKDDTSILVDVNGSKIAYDAAKFKIYIDDVTNSKGIKLSAGVPSDLIPSESAGADNASKVIIRTNNGELRELIIVKN